MLLAFVVGVAIGTLAWFVVLRLGELLQAWLASGCSLALVLSSASVC
jgi:hypothetical protein